MIHTKLEELKLQLNYVCYDIEMLPKLNSVWKTFYEMETEVKKLHKHNVSGSLPTDNEISAMAILTVNLEDSDTAKIIHRAAFEAGARWAISELSGQ